jgi:putative exosortase-associated protein (TIGR04073 family)
MKVVRCLLIMKGGSIVKRVLFVLLAIMFLAASTMCFADSEEYTKAMGDRAYWGSINALTGWIEIPAQVAKGYEYGWMGKENTGWVGAIGGVAAGVGSAIGRTIHGVGELVGCWAAVPETNDRIGIPLDAEFAWEEGTPYDMMDPSFEEATSRPVLYKLGRGLGNLAFGVCEIPGQIMKGIEEKAWDIGIIKGIWYFLSREIDGAIDTATFCFPGPRDVRGVAFDEKWPWSAVGDRSSLGGGSGTTSSTSGSSMK